MMLDINKLDLVRHREPATFADRAAARISRMMSAAARALFGRRYGGHAIVLETISAVPGMVAATLLHLKCLRRMIDDRGWVRVFMEEAENQRAHLMVFVAIRRPSPLERLLIVLAQGAFYNAFFLLYLLSPRTAHRLAGYLSEAAVRGYSHLLGSIERGEQADIPAPSAAIAYWDLEPEARLADVIKAMREDEAIHRDINHAFADALAKGNPLPERLLTE
ncbi:alternative oxidase [Brucella endophytica]|nr:alternative oxidase [Brucella endophytica]